MPRQTVPSNVKLHTYSTPSANCWHLRRQRGFAVRYLKRPEPIAVCFKPEMFTCPPLVPSMYSTRIGNALAAEPDRQRALELLPHRGAPADASPGRDGLPP